MKNIKDKLFQKLTNKKKNTNPRPKEKSVSGIQPKANAKKDSNTKQTNKNQSVKSSFSSSQSIKKNTLKKEKTIKTSNNQINRANKSTTNKAENSSSETEKKKVINKTQAHQQTTKQKNNSNQTNCREKKQRTRMKIKISSENNASKSTNENPKNSTTPNLSPQLLALKLRGYTRGNKFENRYIRLSSQCTPEKLRKQLPLAPNKSVKVIPLGGLCEIGKNMTAFEYGQDIIIVDVGVAFPDEKHLGIDSVIPDFQYIIQNKNRVRGIFLTHGHEDHIGSLPWLMQSISCPIYARPLTAKLVELKLIDKGVTQAVKNLRICQCNESYRAGAFSVEFINVNHSIADSSALAIKTPVGLIIHSGDFKVDYTPIQGDPIDLHRFAELGKEGVLLFMCESTNVNKEGYSMSESSVATALSQSFEAAQGRVFVATFSSNVHRVQQIISAAEAQNRKCVLIGRSMLNVFNAANSLNYIKMKKETLIDIRDIDQYPDEALCVIMTGSQGEPLSALTRIAYAEHRNLDIREGDTVILSSTPIPGNERAIYKVIDELYKRGAEVIYSALAEVHVSGHAYLEEIKLLHALIKPKYFIPIHGEYHMLCRHANLSHELGKEFKDIFILNNGDIFACNKDFANVVGYTQANAVLIDGQTASPANTQILNERKLLGEEGVVNIAILLKNKANTIHSSIHVETKGFVFECDNQNIESEFEAYIKNHIQKQTLKNLQSLATDLKAPAFNNSLSQFLLRKTGRKPSILISVIIDK